MYSVRITARQASCVCPTRARELDRIGNLGLQKIAALPAELGVEPVADLKAACEAGRARTVKGIGKKTERRILESIRTLESAAWSPEPTRVLLSYALDITERLLAHLRAAPGIRQARR